MKITELNMSRTLVFLAAGLLAGAGAMAEKPEWAGNGKQGKSEQKQMHDQPGRSVQTQEHAAPRQAQSNRPGKSAQGQQGTQVRVGSYFNDTQRTAVRTYYGEQYRAGNCPPGLAKKNNGCMPPGQARKWNVGRALPSDVVYYSVPQSVIIQLGAPPSGQRYVRVGSDILLLAIGTGMVIDAIQNLGGL
ncbi:RcnB family protein [Polaromonas sp.]|jgi:Ni/Co efflux regulator RcnB|uniref:RcnB family protein n=1 Tax=Polaromonas sp. TaxID=1869339 RepID=UPI001DF5DF4E|nr:RcnB family protein [Polaromonas sp.]MBT9477351.1 RcnB family protein [Polaromonas sp.]